MALNSEVLSILGVPPYIVPFSFWRLCVVWFRNKVSVAKAGLELKSDPLAFSSLLPFGTGDGK